MKYHSLRVAFVSTFGKLCTLTDDEIENCIGPDPDKEAEVLCRMADLQDAEPDTEIAYTH